jgi:AcrR family transcriptional regulator
VARRTKTSAPQPVDGRHARSERTRAAIADALLELLAEGRFRPTADEIADRAGVSRRSLFNHFADVDDLLETAAQRHLERIAPHIPPLPTEGSAAERVEAFTARITDFYERVAPTRRAAEAASHESRAIAGRIREAHRVMRASIEIVFAPELSAARPEERDVLTAALVASSSFTLWDELRVRHQLAPAAALSVMRRMLLSLLQPFLTSPEAP